MSICTTRPIAIMELVSTHNPSGEQKDAAQLGWFRTLDIINHIENIVGETAPSVRELNLLLEKLTKSFLNKPVSIQYDNKLQSWRVRHI